MPTEINMTNDVENSEKKGLILRRIRIEEAKSDSDKMPGMDYPSGLLISD